jgi:transcriptional regulator of aroF, aroG, tyrA and aromatic amino acid transport
MSQIVRVYLLVRDRVGVVADISERLARGNLNILSMEVERTDRYAHVYTEVDIMEGHYDSKRIERSLTDIPDLSSIRFIQTLPREKRENTFRVVLDNIRDGILSIDNERRVRTINSVAKRILGCEGRDVEGVALEELNMPDRILSECLEGKAFTNSKRSIITDKGRYRFFATGKPITDSSGRIVGAVEIMKDMVEVRELAQEVTLPERITFSDFIGRSPVVREALSFAQKIAKTDFVVSVRGGSGTGKELLAQAIHTESGRKGPFVPVNCAALPESLLESELFGYVEGAFTGARRGGKAGLFEIAKNGTVFLDEIADIPPGQQAKILRVIQEKSIRRIGGEEEIGINARIITATNRNLEQMVEEGKFRKDLYYRINVLPIHIPPLKERKEDIPSLAEHFLFQFNAKLGKISQYLEPGAVEKLVRYDWPGNVRELRNVIERAAILAEKDHIDEAGIFFSFEIGRAAEKAPSEMDDDELGNHSIHDLVGKYERDLISDTLTRFTSVRKAALWLGVSHTTLLNKIKKYQLRLERKSNARKLIVPNQ